MTGLQEHSTPLAHLFVRRSLRFLQQEEYAHATSNAIPTTTADSTGTSATVNRLSLAAIILVPLLLFTVVVMCVILYCYYLPYLRFKDQKQQYHIKHDSNSTTLDHNSDGENGSDSTEADDSLNESNPPIIQSVEVDTDDVVVVEERPQANAESINVAPTFSIARVASQSSLDRPTMTMLLRRPSYSKTLEETLLQYGTDASTTDIAHTNTNPTPDDDDDATTATNGPIDIDDGTSYDCNDDNSDDGITAAIRADVAHSPIDQILIFSDMETSSDDGDNDDDDDEASLSQRVHDHEPYARFYKSYPASTTGHRLAAITTTGNGAVTNAATLLSLLNFENSQCQKPAITDHSTNIFKVLTSNKSTKSSFPPEEGPKDDIQPTTTRPALRRNCSISSSASSSSSLYGNIEEQAWIEFQQQSFDNGDTQKFAYQPPQSSSSLSLSPSKSFLLLQRGDSVCIEDDDDYYSKRMENVQSLDCKNISSNNTSTLVTQFDDLQRQRQLWDRIQHLPLSPSSIPLSSKKQSQASSLSTDTSPHLPRQKVEL